MERSSFSVSEFLERNGISHSTWHKLRREGRAPRVMELGAAVRITLEAERDWQRAQEAWTESAAGRLASERRRELALRAGAAAAASPKHVSKMGPRKKACG